MRKVWHHNVHPDQYGKHRELELQSLSPILLRRRQSEGEAMEDPWRPSKAAPTHLERGEGGEKNPPEVAFGVNGLHGGFPKGEGLRPKVHDRVAVIRNS